MNISIIMLIVAGVILIPLFGAVFFKSRYSARVRRGEILLRFWRSTNKVDYFWCKANGKDLEPDSIKEIGAFSYNDQCWTREPYPMGVPTILQVDVDIVTVVENNVDALNPYGREQLMTPKEKIMLMNQKHDEVTAAASRDFDDIWKKLKYTINVLPTKNMLMIGFAVLALLSAGMGYFLYQIWMYI